MTAGTQQLVEYYETYLPTIEELQSQFPDYEVESIKTVLAQFSSLYRKQLKESGKDKKLEKPDDISDDEFETIKAGLKNLAFSGEDEHVRARLLKFLWDEKKGRNNVVSSKSQTNINVSVQLINNQIQRAKLAKAKALGQLPPVVVDVEAQPA